MDNATTIIGFVVAGVTIGGVIAAFLKWQIKRERDLFLSQVREEIRATVNGKIDLANQKLDAMRSEADERHTDTQARLAEGSAHFEEIHRIQDRADSHRNRLETRIDNMADQRK